MARNSRSEIERRMRNMARAKVDMLLGTYPFADGRPNTDPEGNPVVSVRELLRIGDYNPSYRDAERRLFSDPYFVAQVKVEMARREKRLLDLSSVQPGRLTKLNNLILDTLEARLENDAASFSNAQLLAAVRDLRPYVAEEQKELNGSESASLVQQFNTMVNAQINVMNETERERFVETATDAAVDRREKLKLLLAQTTTPEEADADADDAGAADGPVSR